MLRILVIVSRDDFQKRLISDEQSSYLCFVLTGFLRNTIFALAVMVESDEILRIIFAITSKCHRV